MEKRKKLEKLTETQRAKIQVFKKVMERRKKTASEQKKSGGLVPTDESIPPLKSETIPDAIKIQKQ